MLTDIKLSKTYLYYNLQIILLLHFKLYILHFNSNKNDLEQNSTGLFLSCNILYVNVAYTLKKTNIMQTFCW